MNIKKRIPVKRKINEIQLKKRNRSSYLEGTNYRLDNKIYWFGDKNINLNNSQKFGVNTSSLINGNNKGNSFSSKLNHTNISENLLYDV